MSDAPSGGGAIGFADDAEATGAAENVEALAVTAAVDTTGIGEVEGGELLAAGPMAPSIGRRGDRSATPAELARSASRAGACGRNDASTPSDVAVATAAVVAMASRLRLPCSPPKGLELGSSHASKPPGLAGKLFLDTAGILS